MHDYLDAMAVSPGAGSSLELPTTVHFNAPELMALAEGPGGDPAMSLAAGAVAVAIVIARLFGR